MDKLPDFWTYLENMDLLVLFKLAVIWDVSAKR
jgi:hypothetical protein